MKPIVEKVLSLSSSEPRAESRGSSRGLSTQSRSGATSVEESRTRHLRIIVDHLKAATFIIADGISPSNVDQGYVLRKIIRRSVRSGRQLGIGDSSFTADIAAIVAAEYGDAYPHIRHQLSSIQETLTREEQQFRKTLQEGLKQFEKAKERASGTINGESAFHLYDTYGFPLELTKEVAAEEGLKVDEAGFQKAFEAHQTLSRAGAEKRFAGGLADHSAETTKLHTATHLLNAALRKVLGGHVWQKGSNVTAERLRFDFSHPAKMTPEELKRVRHLGNKEAKGDLPFPPPAAPGGGEKAENAVGVFDDRYCKEVKVYVVGDKEMIFSKEICGGPHVARTGMLGSFKIQKEESSSSGIRRIKATVAD